MNDIIQGSAKVDASAGLALEPTFECAQQLLLQATLAGLMRDRALLADVIERASKAGILKIIETEDGGLIRTRIGIPGDMEEEAA